MGTVRSYDACVHKSLLDDRSVRVILMQSGLISGSYSGDPFQLTPGSVTLMRGTEKADGTAETPSSRVGLQVQAEYFESPRFGGIWGEPISIESDDWNAFFQFCQAFLNRADALDLATAEDFSLGAASLLRGMLSSSLRRDSTRKAERQDRALRAINEVIERRFRNSDFSVTQLAEELFMSESTLRRLCGNVGTTPSFEIRQRRIAEANRLLEGHPRHPAEYADAIAHSSGFSSRVMMYRNLSQLGDARQSS